MDVLLIIWAVGAVLMALFLGWDNENPDIDDVLPLTIAVIFWPVIITASLGGVIREWRRP